MFPLIEKITAILANPAFSAIIAIVAPLILAKLNPAVAKIVYTILAAFGIKIPTSISDATWTGLGMSAHAETADDKDAQALDELLSSAKTSLMAGNLENAREISDLFVKRAAASISERSNAASK